MEKRAKVEILAKEIEKEALQCLQRRLLSMDVNQDRHRHATNRRNFELFRIGDVLGNLVEDTKKNDASLLEEIRIIRKETKTLALNIANVLLMSLKSSPLAEKLKRPEAIGNQ